MELVVPNCLVKKGVEQPETFCTRLTPLHHKRDPRSRVIRMRHCQCSAAMYLRLAYEAVASLGVRAGYGGTRNGGTRLTWLA